MVQALAIINGVKFNKKLVNEIRTRNLTINVVAISTTKFETKKILKEFIPDIILLDTKAKKLFGKDFFEKYGNIIVELTYSKSDNILSTENLNFISDITKNSDFERCKRRVRNELEYIGYEFKYKGTHYLLDTILEIYNKDEELMVDNLQSGIYPIIAERYNKTVYNIKSSIGKATDYMYLDCDMDRLADYFHFDADEKPTPKQVVFTVINKMLR